MIQVIIFTGSNGNPQNACNEAASKANTFLASMKREEVISVTTQYQTIYALESGDGLAECVIAVVYDNPGEAFIVDAEESQRWRDELTENIYRR